MTASTEIVSVIRLVFHEGQVGKFTRLIRSCKSIVQAQDTGTLQYEAYLSEDQSEAVIVERYTDAHAVIDHMSNIGGALLLEVMSTGTVSQEAYGRLTPELDLAIAQGSVRVFTPLDE